MSEPTIDLQRGLEAWYDFGADYYDSQRNAIEDKSGYGRHAEAEGGPSVGISGPEEFEATRFDGSDDAFVADNISAFQEQSGVVIARPNADERGSIFSNSDYSTGFTMERSPSGSFRVLFYDDSGNSVSPTVQDFPANQWAVFGFSWDGEEITVFGNDDSVTSDLTTHTLGNRPLTVGSWAGGVSNQFDGDIALAARWSRPFTPVEAEYLRNLTGPRRTHL